MTNEIMEGTSHKNYDGIKAQMERLALKKKDRFVIASFLILRFSLFCFTCRSMGRNPVNRENSI